MTFNPDNKVVAALSSVVDVIEILFLAVICSIPVVTIGASVTAMHRTMMDHIMKRCSSVHKTFFKAFKDEFKIATLIWLTALLLGGVLFVNFNICWGYTGSQTNLAQALKGLVVVFTCAWFVIFTFAFANLARFKVTYKQAMKNAVLLSIGRLGRSVEILILKFIIVFSIWFIQVYAIPVVGLCVWLENRVLIKAMLGKNYFEEAEKESQEIYYE